AAAIEQVSGVHKKPFSTGVLNTPEQAQSMGDFHLLRSAYPVGEFTEFTFAVEDAATLALMLALSVGDMISITEVQTGETDRNHAVIGESFEFDNAELFNV